MTPIALGWGAAPSFRAPMAFVVIGGLITSTLLSLLVTPVVYSCLDDGVRWVAQWVTRYFGGRPLPAATDVNADRVS